MKKIILSLIAASTLTFLCVGCGSDEVTGTNTASGKNPNSSSSNASTGTNENVDFEKNLVTSGAVTKKGKLVVFVTNNNNVDLDYEIEAEFYDADGNVVGSDTESITGAGKKSEIAVEMYSTPEKFDNYKIYVDVSECDDVVYLSDLSIKHNDTKEEVVVQVTNNSSEIIEYMETSVVFYKNGEVVGFDYDTESDVKSGRSGNFKLSHPYDKKYDDVKYDTYKVFVNEAYSYNW